MSSEYRIDVIYPFALSEINDATGLFSMDERIQEVAGCRCGSAGSDFRGRDMQFYFDTAAERDAVADKLSAENEPNWRVIRRTDLDPTGPPTMSSDQYATILLAIVIVGFLVVVCVERKP